VYRTAILVLPALLMAAVAGAQDSATSTPQRGNTMPPVPPSDFRKLPQRFYFSEGASALLKRLWTESVAEQREHVACLSGVIEDDRVQVTSVLMLAAPHSDSLGVSAQVSIDTCSPPAWLGTVHTHIALRDGQHPYPNFSGADRGINASWWVRWQQAGMFCVLYSPSDAYCETYGAGGTGHMSRGPY
jgi:hypothetical protein